MNTIIGDITKVTSGYILQGCNAQGKMNSGVAKAIRDKWGVVYRTYKYQYDNLGFFMGDYVHVQITPSLAVLNLITQEEYGRDGIKYVSYDAIDKATKAVAKNIPVGSKVYFPLIGAGLGGGDWDIISKILEKNLESFECYLVVLPD